MSNTTAIGVSVGCVLGTILIAVFELAQPKVPRWAFGLIVVAMLIALWALTGLSL